MNVVWLKKICGKYSSNDCYVDPVPSAKANNARRSLRLPSEETIIALVDFTLFGDAEKCMVITERGVHWKNFAEESPRWLSWEEFGQRHLAERKKFLSKVIDLGNGLTMEFSGLHRLSELDNHLVINFLQELKGLQNRMPLSDPSEEAPSDPAEHVPLDSVDEAHTDAAEQIVQREMAGSILCEFCKGLVKPGVVYCKHCGIRLGS